MLDRPWLETPFVFQGFEIQDRFEIEQLQAYCSQVYVDVDRGSLTEAQIRALAAGAPAGQLGAGRGTSERHSLQWLHKLATTLGLDGLPGFRGRRHTGAYPITTTARAEAPHARLAYDRAASRYLTIFERTRRVGAIDMAAVDKALKPAIDSILRNPDAMAWTVFSGKRTTRHYSRAAATAVWAVIFGRHLGFDHDALQKLATGAYLLDIGNTALPEKLLKTEGAMPLDDFARVSEHVQAGLDVLNRSRDIPAEVFDMVAFHHERFDGSGYPGGHGGSALPPCGRIAGIVDSYDAMTTRTSYSPAMAGYDAARELNESRGKLFHVEVVGQFLHAIGMFPTGSIVELNDGRIGLVLEQNRDNPLQPKLLLL
jgi:HD-GYP domain-containing protein (c-di-GMP phosphodiesterase class II)